MFARLRFPEALPFAHFHPVTSRATHLLGGLRCPAHLLVYTIRLCYLGVKRFGKEFRDFLKRPAQRPCTKLANASRQSGMVGLKSSGNPAPRVIEATVRTSLLGSAFARCGWSRR